MRLVLTPAFLSAGSGASEVSVLLEDNSDIWINVTNVLYFLEDGSDRFIWASEVHTGYRQLYLVSPGQRVTSLFHSSRAFIHLES